MIMIAWNKHFILILINLLTQIHNVLKQNATLVISASFSLRKSWASTLSPISIIQCNTLKCDKQTPAFNNVQQPTTSFLLCWQA